MPIKLPGVALFALTALLLPACYTTRVETRAPVSGVYDDRQWFLLWGAVRVSDPAGKECPDGVAFTESKMGVVDYLINAAIVVGTGLGLGAACGDNMTCRNAAFGVGGFAGSLIGTRTVTYGCRAGYAALPSHPAARPAAAPPPTVPDPAPVTPPRPKTKDEVCLDSDFCSKYGRCASDGKRCVATSDAGCKLSLGCQSGGKCRASGGECVK